jgi:ParB family transcriptional regulator, chromosome partitioning protein
MPYSLSKPRFIRVPLQIVKKSLIEHLTNISVNMELIKKKVSELIPYINNSRTHSEEQVTQIVSSIKEFGFTNPILIDKDNSIIAGHGRLQAVKRLGLEEVPCILISGLTKTQIKALIIADNQLALNAGWDLEKLSVEIEGLEEDKFDLSHIRF